MTPLPPGLHQTLLRTPPNDKPGFTAHQISISKLAPAVDRTIARLKKLVELGYVERPPAGFVLAQNTRGYRRTKSGDALIQQLDWETA